jgi:hypothetical protein
MNNERPGTFKALLEQVTGRNSRIVKEKKFCADTQIQNKFEHANDLGNSHSLLKMGVIDKELKEVVIAQTERASYRKNKSYSKFGKLKANTHLNMHEKGRPKTKYKHKKIISELHNIEPRIDSIGVNSLLRIKSLRKSIQKRSRIREESAQEKEEKEEPVMNILHNQELSNLKKHKNVEIKSEMVILTNKKINDSKFSIGMYFSFGIRSSFLDLFLNQYQVNGKNRRKRREPP